MRMKCEAWWLRNLKDMENFLPMVPAACFAPAAGRPRVMLAAHMDEIGFLVQNIASNGFLQLVGIGGWWPHTLLSQRVLVKTARAAASGG